jgi:hypothetical protein
VTYFLNFLVSSLTMSGPPAGIKLSPEQVAVMKEQGVRGVIMEDIGGAFGPFIMG